MKLHLILPSFKKNAKDWHDSRDGYTLSLDTGFSYCDTDGDLPSWFSAYILGIGIGVSWNHQEWY